MLKAGIENYIPLEKKTKVIIGVLLVVTLIPTIFIIYGVSLYRAKEAELADYERQYNFMNDKIDIYNTTLTCVSYNRCSISDFNKAHNDLYQSLLDLQRRLNHICSNHSIMFDEWCNNAKQTIDVRLKMLGEGNSTESELQQIAKIGG